LRVQDITGIPPALAQVLVTAHQVAPEWHVRMQAAFQAHIDNAVSKTVNLPAAATVSDVDRIFRLAYAQRCKGITVYRDGSRSGQFIAPLASSAASPQVSIVRSRGRVTTGQTFKFRMACGTLFVTVNRDDQGLCEVFANLGKAGGCRAQSEATCRAASVALRSGVDPRQIIEQLSGITCAATARAKGNGQDEVRSCPDAIARALAEALGSDKGAETGAEPSARKCPDCGATLGRQAGCWVCTCGFSRCG
jgi:ribonucleoside-diphosphate reductase alpha chain